MYPLPGSPGENEHITPEFVDQDRRTAETVFFWCVVAGWVVFTIRRVMNEDEIQLHTLHLSIRMLQSIARTVGRWGLNAEKSYNDMVNVLH